MIDVVPSAMPRALASFGLISRKPSPLAVTSLVHGRSQYCECVRNLVWVDRNVSGYFLASGLLGEPSWIVSRKVASVSV